MSEKQSRNAGKANEEKTSTDDHDEVRHLNNNTNKERKQARMKKTKSTPDSFPYVLSCCNSVF
jgi:hypothetical protein